MALVDDDEIEEVRGIFAEIGGGVSIFGRAAHKGLEDGEEEARVLRHFAFLADFVGLDARHSVLGKSGEGVVSLVGEDIAVGEEENAGTSRRLAAQVPAAVKQLPCDLEGDKGFAGAGRESQEDAL